MSKVEGIDEGAAKLAIESCRNNEARSFERNHA